MNKPFSVLFPNLTSGEINMLVRLLEDEVMLSAEQRKRLHKLVKEETS